MAGSNSKKRTGLGRGLSALLADSDHQNKIDQGKGESFPNSAISEIPIKQIETNPWQPRTDFDKISLDELAESIKAQGIIQPVTVRSLSKNEFQIISGERRLHASKKAGLETIPAYIRTANDQQMLEMSLVENIQRENLNAIEIGLSFQRLITECHLKQEELGNRIGKNRTTVTNYLRLLKLPPDIQIALRDKKLSMGHARALISIEDVDLQLDLLKQILQKNLSVRKVEELVRLSHQKESHKNSMKGNIAPEIKNLQTKLSSHFGTKISVKANSQNKGEIKIPFYSTEDLNRIIEMLNV